MWLTNSSVGRKVVMSVTGLFLILFLTFHALMNAVALISFDAYEAVCEFLGANWYALVGTAVLAGGFVIHIIFAFWLSMQNRKAASSSCASWCCTSITFGPRCSCLRSWATCHSAVNLPWSRPLANCGCCQST